MADPVLEADGAVSQTGMAGMGLPAELADAPINDTGVLGVTPAGATLPALPVTPQRGVADRFARWALRVHDPVDGQEVHNIFSASMALSGTRCLLSYIVLPLLAPWLGALPFIGPAIGIPVGVLALVFDVRAMRRFFQSDHRWRWVAAIVYLAVMVMVATLVVRDISHLL
jgi:hypothetical protein